ncbi:L,D-transpeptidase family protein [Mucilaginibacter sp. CAU 1740]|uniref:L,D-transpeptidase family protein n=1 Tax=Mucilaginibacter sp. CAU 1740 TaxID=3140365 RepID=UPI00325AC8CA
MKKISFAVFLLFCSVMSFPAFAETHQDSLVKQAINSLLSKDALQNTLHFPATVRRLYRGNNGQALWIRPQNGEGPAWQVMMLLDCVLQYGLSPASYHPTELTYNRLHRALDTVGKVSPIEAGKLDIFLSDAIITFVNHLHYGKFNPLLTTGKIDQDSFKGFQADSAVLAALPENKPYEFWSNIERTQPQDKAYRDLQRRMRLLEGQYSGDNYQVSDQEVRLIAVNMERMRWLPGVSGDHIRINLPAFDLSYQYGNNVEHFRVAIGRAATPTPELSSAIPSLTAAPDVVLDQDRFVNELLPRALRDSNFLRKNQYALYDKKGTYQPSTHSTLDQVALYPDDYRLRHASGHDGALGRLVFRFNNPYRIDLHDMPRKAFFEQRNRAITTGCIWLDDAEKLGKLVLLNDGQVKKAAQLGKAMKKYQRKVYMLQRPLPIVITYLTVLMNEGTLVVYPDIYHKDAELAARIFPSGSWLVAEQTY